MMNAPPQRHLYHRQIMLLGRFLDNAESIERRVLEVAAAVHGAGVRVRVRVAALGGDGGGFYFTGEEAAC